MPKRALRFYSGRLGVEVVKGSAGGERQAADSRSGIRAGA
jgi:hypothetical protein